MPTILNNACINRVQKVLKLKLTSNDLTAMKVTPFQLLRGKIGDICNLITNVIVFVPSDHGYQGNLILSSQDGGFSSFVSYVDENSSSIIGVSFSGGVTDWYYLSVDPDFEIGSTRPDIEVHFYYYSESVSVDYDFGYVQSV
jgi:hypothetical protein